MLKQRLLTALILLPFLIWGILQLPTAYFALLLGLVIVQGAWEWGRLMQLQSTKGKILVALSVTAGLYACWWLLGQNEPVWLSLLVVALFWWLLALIWVVSYPRMASRWSSTRRRFLIGLLILAPTWLSLVALHGEENIGPYLVLYLLSLIWVADSGAYFGGRTWGKHKLAVAVSPGKTWEGVAAAIIATTVYSFAATILLQLPVNQWLVFVVLSLLTVVFSILGDLNESMFKRHAGVKDSGTLLPGHGGVLDRIDSITAAAPVFVVGLWLGDFTFFGVSGG